MGPAASPVVSGRVTAAIARISLRAPYSTIGNEKHCSALDSTRASTPLKNQVTASGDSKSHAADAHPR